MSPRRRQALAVAIACAVLVIHARHYLPYMSDDAFISLRYAERLLEGKGLTWNDGERVEGYSNLLWVLVISALGASRVDLVSAARILGVMGMIGAVLSIFWSRRDDDRSGVPTLLGGLSLALSGSIAVLAGGELAAVASREHPAVLYDLSVGAGRWRVRAEAAGGEAIIEVAERRSRRAIARGHGEVEILSASPGEESFDVSITPRTGSVIRVGRLVFERL